MSALTKELWRAQSEEWIDIYFAYFLFTSFVVFSGAVSNHHGKFSTRNPSTQGKHPEKLRTLSRISHKRGCVNKILFILDPTEEFCVNRQRPCLVTNEKCLLLFSL